MKQKNVKWTFKKQTVNKVTGLTDTFKHYLTAQNLNRNVWQLYWCLNETNHG